MAIPTNTSQWNMYPSSLFHPYRFFVFILVVLSRRWEQSLSLGWAVMDDKPTVSLRDNLLFPPCVVSPRTGGHTLRIIIIRNIILIILGLSAWFDLRRLVRLIFGMQTCIMAYTVRVCWWILSCSSCCQFLLCCAGTPVTVMRYLLTHCFPPRSSFRSQSWWLLEG